MNFVSAQLVMDFILRENSGLAAACKKHPNRVICRRIMNYCRCWDLSLDLTHLTYTTVSQWLLLGIFVQKVFETNFNFRCQLVKKFKK